MTGNGYLAQIPRTDLPSLPTEKDRSRCCMLSLREDPYYFRTTERFVETLRFVRSPRGRRMFQAIAEFSETPTNESRTCYASNRVGQQRSPV